MYTGSDPYLRDLQTQITELKGRMNAVDGQNLTDPDQGVLNQLSRRIEGLRADLKAAVAKLEQILGTVNKTVAGYAATVKQHLGI